MIEYLQDLPIIEVVVILLATFLAAGRVTSRLERVEVEVKKQGKQQVKLRRALYRHINSKRPPPCSTGSEK